LNGEKTIYWIGLILIGAATASVPMWYPAFGSLDVQPSIYSIGDVLWNASGRYSVDLEQGVEYCIEVAHVSGDGAFVFRDPDGGVLTRYEWRNPPEGGRGELFKASSSGFHRLEIDGVCHIQVLRYVHIEVGEGATTLKGFLDETRALYGYWIWISQSGAEHPGPLVEVEIKLKVPEGADFNLCSASRFFAQPLQTEGKREEGQEETLVFNNGPESLLLFVRRASGEGEYSLTVRAYKACLKDLFSVILLDKTTMGILLVVVGTLWFLVLLLTKGSKLSHDQRKE